MVLGQRELQQLADVAAAGASGDTPLSLQGTPQPGQENTETERAQREPRALKPWYYGACKTKGCKCPASWDGDPNEKCCRRCALEYPCSQQYGGGSNHGKPSAVPLGRRAMAMPKKKDGLIVALQELGITASKATLGRSNKQELVAQLFAAQCVSCGVTAATQQPEGDESKLERQRGRQRGQRVVVLGSGP